MPARREVLEAERELARRDGVVASLVARSGPCRLPRRRPASTDFAALARSILYQQLAGRAAAAIHGRFVQAVGGAVTAETVGRTDPDRLRAAGLSQAKAASVLDLAAKVSEGTVVLGGIGRREDEEVVGHLTQVRGIGRWTAEMFLMFQLGRLDVWPAHDHGVRKGFATAWDLPGRPPPSRLDELGERFRPYRSVVAWYCWRVADTVVPGDVVDGD